MSIFTEGNPTLGINHYQGLLGCGPIFSGVSWFALWIPVEVRSCDVSCRLALGVLHQSPASLEEQER